MKPFPQVRKETLNASGLSKAALLGGRFRNDWMIGVCVVFLLLKVSVWKDDED